MSFDVEIPQSSWRVRSRFVLRTAISFIAFGALSSCEGCRNHVEAVDVITDVRKTLLLPPADQAKHWRDVIANSKSDLKLVQQAVMQLARLRDKDALPLFFKLFSETDDHATVRVLSMAFLEYPHDQIDAARASARKHLKDRDTSDEPQVAALLVYLQDKDSFDTIFEIYKKNGSPMTSAKTVDGVAAFDPEDLANLADRPKFRGLAKDESEGVRLLVATVLSKKPSGEDRDTLVALLSDKSLEVSSMAAIGIAQLQDQSAIDLLVKKLTETEKADNDVARERYINSLRDGIGGAGLILALRAVAMKPESHARVLLEEIRALHDPGAAAEYKKFIADPTRPAHYRAQVALALADIGDPDAVPYLAERLDQKGVGFKCDPPPTDMCLSSNLGWTELFPVDADPVSFKEQINAANDIEDFAKLYPDQREKFLKIAGPHLKQFNDWFSKMGPWLQTVGALAYMGDKDVLEWARKTIKNHKLPDEKATLADAPMLLEENNFATATRFIGFTGDDAMRTELESHLARPKDSHHNLIRLSDEGMSESRAPAFFEALRETTRASIEGLAQWGPGAEKSAKKLLEVIKDIDHDDFCRLNSGRALGLIGSEQDILDAITMAKTAKDPMTKWAILIAAQYQPTPKVVEAIFGMFDVSNAPESLVINSWVARVVGWGGTKGYEQKLIDMMDKAETRWPAALTIMLGGDEDLLRRGLALFMEKAGTGLDKEMALVKRYYLDTFDGRGIREADVDSGRLYRFVQNALIMRRIGEVASAQDNIGGAESARSLTWATMYLTTGLNHLNMNSEVPGGMDSLIMRWKLLKAAKEGDDATKRAAVATFQFLKEKGVLRFLQNEQGLTGELAHRAYFLLLHPEGEASPQAKEKVEDGKYFSKVRK